MIIVLFTGYIKYVSLVILTVQNAALGLSMRYARTRDVEMFSSAAGKYCFNSLLSYHHTMKSMLQRTLISVNMH